MHILLKKRRKTFANIHHVNSVNYEDNSEALTREEQWDSAKQMQFTSISAAVSIKSCSEPFWFFKIINLRKRNMDIQYS